MAGSRLPRQLFLQGVAAVFLFAFASLYTQIPGEGAERGTPRNPRLCPPLSPRDTPLSSGGSEVQALMLGGECCSSCRVWRVGGLTVVPFPKGSEFSPGAVIDPSGRWAQALENR